MTLTFPYIEQAYWWLSLLAGLHCLFLSLIFLGRGWRAPTAQLFILGVIFGLLCIFYAYGVLGELLTEPWRTFTGVFTACVSLFILPLSYQYYIVSLYPEQNAIERKNPHYISAVIIAIFVLVAYVINPSVVSHSYHSPKTLVWFTGIESVSEILPNVLLIQVGVYLVLMYRLLGGYRYQFQKAQSSKNAMDDCHWLFVVTGVILVNWFIAISSLTLSHVLNTSMKNIVEVFMHFTWLLSLYLLTLYRLQQLIQLQIERSSQSENAIHKPSILNDEERDFIKKVIKD